MKFKDTIVWKIIKNKYFIAVVLFLLVVCFLDKNNLLVVHSLRRDVAQLNHTIDTMRQGFVEDSLQAERLKYDLDSIERYGRENYYMKRKNEDVFVVTQASE